MYWTFITNNPPLQKIQIRLINIKYVETVLIKTIITKFVASYCTILKYLVLESYHRSVNKPKKVIKMHK